MSPKNDIRVLLIHALCRKTYRAVPNAYATSEQCNCRQSKRDEEVSKASHCQYRYCTYGLETMCLAVMIDSLTSLVALNYFDLVP